MSKYILFLLFFTCTIRGQSKINKFSFEFRIVVDDITLDATLVVTDYVDENDENEMRLLWNSQIHNLLHTIGA
jgi:hypothetical protein